MKKTPFISFIYNDMANGFTNPRQYKILDGVFYQKCNRCGKWLTKDKFTTDSTAKFGIKAICKECRIPIQKICRHLWYEKNKERSNESCRKYHVENLEKINNARNERIRLFENKYGFSWEKFHHKARYYTKSNKLKPKFCMICGRSGNIEIHHPSYETFEMWSVVVFCCKYCHSAIHKGILQCPTPINLLECNRH